MILKRKLSLWILTLLFITNASAQMEVGGGLSIGFPLLFNGAVQGHNHASGAPGVNFLLNYTPPNAGFTGTFKAGASLTILPVARLSNGLDVLYMRFSNIGASVHGRYRKDYDNGASFLFGPGIGVNRLNGQDIQFSQRSENEITYVEQDSTFYNQTTVPSFFLNAEYIKPLKAGSSTYYGIGFQLQYVYFLDQGKKYRVDIVDENTYRYVLYPELKGHMINPILSLNLYYRLNSNRNY